MKKFVIIAGMVAMAGTLFLASPVSADQHTLSATLNDDGSATITGAGWQAAQAVGIYVSVCPGADVTSDMPVDPNDTVQALADCPTVITDASNLKPTIADDGSWSYDLSADKIGTPPVVVIVGCLPLGCREASQTGFVVVQEAEESPPTTTTTTSTTTTTTVAEMTSGAGGDDTAQEMEDKNMVDQEGINEEGMEAGEMTEMSGNDDTVMMANTGSESGFLAVIGVSILLAGLFAVGLGRRLTKRS